MERLSKKKTHMASIMEKTSEVRRLKEELQNHLRMVPYLEILAFVFILNG